MNPLTKKETKVRFESMLLEVLGSSNFRLKRSAPQVKRSSNDLAYEALAQWAVVLEP